MSACGGSALCMPWACPLLNRHARCVWGEVRGSAGGGVHALYCHEDQAGRTNNLISLGVWCHRHHQHNQGLGCVVIMTTSTTRACCCYCHCCYRTGARNSWSVGPPVYFRSTLGCTATRCATGGGGACTCTAARCATGGGDHVGGPPCLPPLNRTKAG